MKKLKSWNKEMDIINGYRELASAIVGRAILDYLLADDSKEGKETKEEVIDFVNSEWFGDLTDIKPKYVEERLNSGVKGRYMLSVHAGWGNNRCV